MKRMRRSWYRPFVVIGLAGGACASPAVACRMDPEPIVYNQFKIVALAPTTSVKLLPHGDARFDQLESNWDADFEVQKVLLGSVKVRHLNRRELPGPSACAHNKAPKVGDLRVVYFWPATKAVAHIVDLDTARREDRRLQKMLPR